MSEPIIARGCLLSYFALALRVNETQLISLWHNLEPSYKAKSVAKEFRTSDRIRALSSSLSPASIWSIRHNTTIPENVFSIHFTYGDINRLSRTFDIIINGRQLMTTCPYHIELHCLSEWEHCVKVCIESMKIFDVVFALVADIHYREIRLKWSPIHSKFRRITGGVTETEHSLTGDRFRHGVSVHQLLPQFEWIAHIDSVRTSCYLMTDLRTTILSLRNRQSEYWFRAELGESDVKYAFSSDRERPDEYLPSQEAWTRTMQECLKNLFPSRMLTESRDLSPSRKGKSTLSKN